MSKIKLSIFATLGLLGCMLAACSTLETKEPSDVERVSARAQARWDFLIAEDYAQAFGLLSPAQRSARNVDTYESDLRRSRVKWQSASVEDVVCEAEVCEVKVKIEIRVVGAVPGRNQYEVQQFLHEQWIQAENEWWYVPK